MAEIIHRKIEKKVFVDASFNLEDEVEKTFPRLTRFYEAAAFTPEESNKAKAIIADKMRVEGRPYDEWPVEYRVDYRGDLLALLVRDPDAWHKERVMLAERQHM